MATGFTGTVADFTNAEHNVTEVRASMDQALSKLRDEVENTKSAWKGDAAGAFDAMMNKFDEDARKIAQSLSQIGELLKEAGSTYEKTEHEQQEILQAVNHGFDKLDG